MSEGNQALLITCRGLGPVSRNAGDDVSWNVEHCVKGTPHTQSKVASALAPLMKGDNRNVVQIWSIVKGTCYLTCWPKRDEEPSADHAFYRGTSISVFCRGTSISAFTTGRLCSCLNVLLGLLT
ncbi:hypothetical protein Q8A67_009793 [Cirrhinus molitorella]|uniref:Uncharacterized protein n=1 Tax=Cirrhinus molitorella TaxID=172907 RepID=A0AA88PYB9_9TELE|nr:hypothetical protein Q8A67_009793 [Cirrhinus molitorella]